MRVEPRFLKSPLVYMGYKEAIFYIYKGGIQVSHLRETLGAYQARDPAARSKVEIFLLYPGIHALIYHRIAHWF